MKKISEENKVGIKEKFKDVATDSTEEERVETRIRLIKIIHDSWKRNTIHLCENCLVDNIFIMLQPCIW